MSLQSRFRFALTGLTVRSAGVSLAVALLVVGAMAVTLWALTRQSQALERLSQVEVEQLMASTRLLQQADLLDNEAGMLAAARTHAERRTAWVALTDRITWVDKLLSDLNLPSDESLPPGELAHRISQLEENGRALNAAVHESIDQPASDAHRQAVLQLRQGNEEMAATLSTQLGLVAANHRRLLAEQSRQLAQDVAAHRNTMIVIAALLLLAVAAAAVWFERVVVRRVLLLKRMVDDGDVLPQALGSGAPDEIASLAQTMGSYVARIRAHEREMNRVNDELTFLADHDTLTQLPNRRFFESRALRRVADPRGPIWVLIGDIDRFKQINDQHGHAVGDLALIHVANLLRTNLRGGEALARFGGEEFVAVVPAPTADAVYSIVERVRAAVAATPMPLPDGGSLPVSISFGLAPIDPPVAMPADAAAPRRALDAALRAADDALYVAKRCGRNRVQLAPVAKPPAPAPAARPARGEALEA